MSDIVVTAKETLVLVVDQPATSNGVFRPTPAWAGSLECKCQDWTLDQIEAHVGKSDYLVKAFKVTQYGEVVNLTDAVLDFMEAAATPTSEGGEAQ